MQKIQVGDVVRVARPEQFVSERKLKDRDAIVLQVGPTALDMFKGQVFLEFQKRNGRGKTFKQWMWLRDLEQQGESK